MNLSITKSKRTNLEYRMDWVVQHFICVSKKSGGAPNYTYCVKILELSITHRTTFFAHSHLVLFGSVLTFLFSDVSLVLNLSIPFLLTQFTHTLSSSNGCGFHPRQHKM